MSVYISRFTNVLSQNKHPFKVVGRFRETQVNENLNCIM